MARIVRHALLAWGVLEAISLVLALAYTFFDPLHHPGATAAFLLILGAGTALVIAFVIHKTKQRQPAQQQQ